MLTLVDGYNVTKSDPATRDLTLEAQRDALVARLRVRGPQLLGSGHIVVVFDGEGGVGGSVSRAGGAVEVRFSRDGSADDAIVSAVKAATGRVLLVTSDRGLAERARSHATAGLEVRGRETLFDGAAGPKRRPKGRYPAGSVGIPAGGNSITRELKKLWLDEEE